PEEFNPHFVPTGQSAILQKTRMDQLLLRPGIHLENLALVSPALKTFVEGISEESATGAEILIKYASYLEREQKWAESMAGLEQIRMRADFEYRMVSGLSLEAAEKLDQHKPENLGQASRISGINPADLSVLMVHLNRKS
ncbi:MAG: tRNA uridine-5-carboxymethylaminomethyl(34) synthesis enzyme MnmG, partial [Bacteroidota bacterium]